MKISSVWWGHAALAVCLSAPLSALATDFYVNSTGGSLTGNGLSNQTAFRDLSQLPLDNLTGNTTVYLRCGSVWYETLSVKNIELREDSLTITSYGNDCDANNLPVIDGGFPLTDWTQTSSDSQGATFKTRSHKAAGYSLMTTQLINSDSRDRYTLARFPNKSEGDSAMRVITHNSVDVDPRQTSEHYFIDRDETTPFWSTNSSLNPVGAELHIRSRNWRLQDRVVTHFDENEGELGWFEEEPVTDIENDYLAIEQAVIKGDCDSCISSGYSYYLSNMAWMMDEIGEWYQQRESKSIFIKTDGTAPADGSIVAAVRDHGIEVEQQGNLSISNITIRNTRYEALRIESSYNYAIENLAINEPGSSGIWIASFQPSAPMITTNRISNNKIENVSAAGIIVERNRSTELTIDDDWSTIIEGNFISGVGNQDYANPEANELQINYAGRFNHFDHKGVGIALNQDKNYFVNNNVIENTAYTAIEITGKTPNPVVTNNRITNFCNSLDDGAGIYIGGSCITESDLSGSGDSKVCLADFNESGTVSGNIIGNGIGNANGVPAKLPSVHGIYLDSETMDTVISDNVIYNVAGAGVYIHVSSDNTVENNTLFENKEEVLLVENYVSGIYKTLSNNVVQGNIMVHLEPTVSANIRSDEDTYAELQDSSSFSFNRYYSPFTMTLITEAFRNGEATHSTLAEWQASTGQDAGSQQLLGYQPAVGFIVPGASEMVNTSFDTGTDGWTCWFPGQQNGCPVSAIDPYTAWNESCDIGQGPCMTLSASSTTPVTAFKPELAVSANEVYLVEFIAQGDSEGLKASVFLRKTNQAGEGWDTLGLSETFSVGTEPQYFSYLFTSLENYADARVEFRAHAGSIVHIDGFSITPVTKLAPVDFEKIAVLVANDTQQNQSFSASVKRGILDTSNAYVDINGVEIPTNNTLGPGESKVLVSADFALRDADSDGVTESRNGDAYYDQCINTELNVPVDRHGCSFAQRQANIPVTLPPGC